MTDSPANAEACADFIWRAHAERRVYENLPAAITPATVDEAYDAQEALHRRLIAAQGPIAGLKIATTTKVMQALMGIDHPCGGAIFSSRVFAAPAEIDLARHVNLRAECEIAVRLGRDLDDAGELSPTEAMAAVSDVAPAFELIEDRNAVYRETRAFTLIADNAWNAGVVLGPWRRFDAAVGLGDVEGALTINGAAQSRGRPDDPFGALAWLADLAARRGRPLRAGMLVITGSLVPTFSLAPGDDVVFSLGPWGETRMRAIRRSSSWTGRRADGSMDSSGS